MHPKRQNILLQDVYLCIIPKICEALTVRLPALNDAQDRLSELEAKQERRNFKRLQKQHRKRLFKDPRNLSSFLFNLSYISGPIIFL